MWMQRVNNLLRSTQKDPEVWPTMVITFAMMMYGGDVALRKLRTTHSQSMQDDVDA